MSELDAYRAEARRWLQVAEREFGWEVRRELSEAEDLWLARRYQAAKHAAGYAGITLPREFGGQDLTPLHKAVFDAEEMPFGLPMGYFGVSVNMPIPVLIRFGREEDRAWIRARSIAALKGEEIWCQLFSEPAAGSDLAGLRTRAVKDGEDWIVTGQKLWTSYAQYSDYGVIVVRTDPEAPKHKGLTYFWIDMRSAGVEVRPLKLASGDSHVNEVFLDDVRIPDSQRLGEVGEGFAVALATLMIERYSGGDSAGFGPPLGAFIALAQRCQVGGRPALEDGRIRSAIARAYALRSGLDAIGRRAFLAMEAGMEPGPEGSVHKLFAVRARQKLSELALDLQGSDGPHRDPHGWVKHDWTASWLNAPTGRVAGGTDEMLLNTIAEKILGLPQDHRPDKGVPFNRIPA
jgi:alkylation response protein AidB-like acyl-CoA dehydrogenase